MSLHLSSSSRTTFWASHNTTLVYHWYVRYQTRHRLFGSRFLSRRKNRSSVVRSEGWDSSFIPVPPMITNETGWIDGHTDRYIWRVIIPLPAQNIKPYESVLYVLTSPMYCLNGEGPFSGPVLQKKHSSKN